MVKRNGFNAAVNIGALLSFIPTVISGFVLFFIFSPRLHFSGGMNPLFSSEFLGLGRSGWLLIHDVTGFFFVAFVAVHLILHAGYFKRWVKQT